MHKRKVKRRKRSSRLAGGRGEKGEFPVVSENVTEAYGKR